MVKKGLVPDTYTYRPLISGFCYTGCVNTAREFVDDLHMKHHKLNEMCFSALMHGYCKEARVKGALAICSEMAERGLYMDLVCYSVLIYGTINEGDPKKLFAILKQMDIAEQVIWRKLSGS
ncbi:hypothetical protein QQ045_024814 [Rhodiola kirilowii]